MGADSAGRSGDIGPHASRARDASPSTPGRLANRDEAVQRSDRQEPCPYSCAVPGHSPSKVADERLRRFELVTDARLAGLDVEELLLELLGRVRECLGVDTAAALLLDRSGQYLLATAACGIEEEVRQGVRIPFGRGFAGRVAAQRQAVIIDEVDHTEVLNPLLGARGIRSLLGVPLLAGGDVLGVLHVGTLVQHRFTADDAAFLQLVADRGATAVAARTSGAERSAATTLQRSLLPAAVPSVPGFEIAARYVPSGNGEIGGDWYDVLPLPSGAVCFVIGDVVGRGLEAAIAMNRLRCAVRAYAMEAEDPAELLGRVDRLVAQFEPDMMATVLCAVLDPSGDELRLSSAGHPPPVVSVGDGVPAAVLELPHDLPIGVDARRRRRASTMTLPPGAVLCLYTDGLVERRGTSIGAGIERLRNAVFAGGAESLCAGVMATMIEPEPMSDDVAVLVVRRLAAQLASLDMQMPAAMSSLGPLRSAVRRWLTDVGAGATEVADLLVAIGEAVTNVVAHAYGLAGGMVSVHLEQQGTDVVAVVGDTGRWRSSRGHRRGHGVQLMEALTDEVRIERTVGGTQVTLRRSVSAKDDE